MCSRKKESKKDKVYNRKKERQKERTKESINDDITGNTALMNDKKIPLKTDDKNTNNNNQMTKREIQIIP